MPRKLPTICLLSCIVTALVSFVPGASAEPCIAVSNPVCVPSGCIGLDPLDCVRNVTVCTRACIACPPNPTSFVWDPVGSLLDCLSILP